MKWPDTILAILITIAWGGFFISSKVSLSSIPPFLLGFLRFFLVFLLTLPFFFKTKILVPEIFFLSIIYFLNNVVLYYATKYSNNLVPVIVVNQLVTPFSLIMGIVFLREKLSKSELLGILIVLIGSGIVIRYRSIVDVNIIAIILSVFSALLFAIYNLLVKKIPQTHPLTLLSQLSLIISILFFGAAIVSNEFVLVKDIEMKSYYALAYLVLISTIFASSSWFYLLKKYPLKKVVPFTIIIPVSGCAMSILTFKDSMNLSIAIGIFLVICGLIILEVKSERN